MVARAEGIRERKPRRHSSLKITGLGKESRSMKPTNTRVARLWCKLMHTEVTWPSHGHYECRTCGQRYRVCWEEPSPATLRLDVSLGETRARSTLARAIESRIQCS